MSAALTPEDPDNPRSKCKRQLRPCQSDPGAPSVHALADDMTELDISARENMEQDEGIPLQESIRAKQQHQRRLKLRKTASHTSQQTADADYPEPTSSQDRHDNATQRDSDLSDQEDAQRPDLDHDSQYAGDGGTGSPGNRLPTPPVATVPVPATREQDNPALVPDPREQEG